MKDGVVEIKKKLKESGQRLEASLLPFDTIGVRKMITDFGALCMGAAR